MTLKEVSVVMCTCNAGEYLRPQLDSVLAQTYPIKEIVIQDDCSTDNTMDILREYQKQYPHIRLFQNTERKGINCNFFSAIGKAASQYIALSDQDDIWRADKIEKLICNIGDNWCCFHGSQHFHGKPDFHATDTRQLNFGLERLIFIGSVPGHAMLIDKILFNMVTEKWDEEKLRVMEKTIYFDTILSSVATAYGKTVYIPEILVYHRVHPDSVTALNRRDLSKRTVKNAVLLVLRNLSPKWRKNIRPLIKERMKAFSCLINDLTPPHCVHTQEAKNIIGCYLGYKPFRFLRFTCLMVRNRNRIFYAPENNQFVATLRALCFPITMYDFFARAYRNEVKRKQNITNYQL